MIVREKDPEKCGDLLAKLWGPRVLYGRWILKAMGIRCGGCEREKPTHKDIFELVVTGRTGGAMALVAPHVGVEALP